MAEATFDPTRRELAFGLDGSESKDFNMIQVQVHEELSRPYRIEALMEPEDPAMAVEVGGMIGKEAYVLLRSSAGERVFAGIISSFEERWHEEKGHAEYRAVIVHPLWKATLTSRARSFLEQPASDIIRAVLGDYDLNPTIDSTSETRMSCVQYYETDFDFVTRLMEEEGLTFFFEYEDGATKPPDMVIQEADTSFPKLDVGEKPGILNVGMELSSFTARVNGIPKRATVDAADVWEKGGGPETSVSEVETANLQAVEGELRYWWGGHHPSRGLVAATVEEASTSRGREIGSRLLEASGVSHSTMGLQVGHAFKLGSCGDFANQEYVITKLDMTVGSQGVRSDSSGSRDIGMRCTFDARRADVPFLVRRAAPRPTVPWVRSGQVTNVDDPEDLGQVQVSLLDSDGHVDAYWARVAQPLASAEFGYFYVPRVNDEVLLAFQEGDPDRPVVVGSLYNGTQTPPSVADKDDVILVNPTGGDNTVVHLKGEEAEGDFDITAGKNMNLSVMDEDLTVTATNDINVTAEGNDINVEAGNDINIHAANNILIEADSMITLKVGESEITMDGSTITIKQGAMTKLELTGDIKAEATNVEAKAQANVKLEATAAAEMKGTASAKVEGAMVDVKGSSMGTFDGGGMASVKGGMVMIG